VGATVSVQLEEKTMRTMLRFSAVLMTLCTCQVVTTQAAEETTRSSERELRTALNKAEKRFLDLYNQVNDDKRQAMSCKNEDVTGSRLRKSRTCRTQAASEISETAARDYVRGLSMSEAIDTDSVTGKQQAAMSRDFGGPVAQQGTGATPGAEYTDDAFADAAARLAAERVAFDKHLQELLQKNPELQQRLDEYLLARQRHDAALKK
jgi:hypothetical protein